MPTFWRSTELKICPGTAIGRRRSDERQVLSDDNHRFFIVSGQQRRCGEHVGVSVGFKRSHERDVARKFEAPVVVPVPVPLPKLPLMPQQESYNRVPGEAEAQAGDRERVGQRSRAARSLARRHRTHFRHRCRWNRN